MKTKSLLFGSLILALLVAVPAWGADFETGEEYILERGQVIFDDLYVAGGSVVISGDVREDLFAVGGKVLINGEVAGDVYASGGTVDVLGRVGDDVRVSGGQVVIGENVLGDVIVVGGVVQILSNVVVRGDVVAAGGRVIIAGSIDRDLKVFGGDVVLNGTVNGNVDATISESLTVGEKARIGGYLLYRAAQEAAISENAVVIGEVIFIEKPEREPYVFAASVFGILMLIKLLAFMAVGVAAVVLFKRFSLFVVRDSTSKFGRNLLYGLVAFIVIPILIAILFATVVGAVAGLLGVAFYGTLLLLSKVYAGIIVGGLLAKAIKKEVLISWPWAIFGIVVLQVLGLVPVVGWIASTIFMLVALGAVLQLVYQRFWVARR